MSIVFSVLATVIDVFIIIAVKESKKFEYLTEGLEGYPLSELYSIGFAFFDMKVFGFKNKLVSKLTKNAALLYGQQYAEYYANIAVAQAFTFISIILGVCFSLAAVFGGSGMGFFSIAAVLGSATVWNFSISVIGDSVKQRRENCISDFPDMVTKFALLINSGMVLRDAWFLVSQNGRTDLYSIMNECCDLMSNGYSDTQAIIEFGMKTDSPEIKKFTSSLVQGIEKGNNELADFLLEQSNEMVARKRQIMLQKGESAAGKLIIPIAITFLGIILIIGFSAMQSMSF